MDYRREVDGLRTLAVLPVILFHAGFGLFSGGFVGVDIFFVISGYLITSIILGEMQSGKFTLIGFYERRARRILPALFFVMLVCLPFAWLWMMPDELNGFAKSLVAVSFFSSNILFWRESGYFDTATELKPLLHTWSLAVEEQYYVLFPLFILLTWRFGKRWMIGILAFCAAISLAVAQWGSLNKPTESFYLLPTRGWELLIGAFVAFYLFGNKNPRIRTPQVSQTFSLIGFLLIAYAIFAFDKSTPFPGIHALAPTVGAALIILFATPETHVGRLLSHRVPVSIGLISYSTYLWHQPLFAFARLRSIGQPSDALFLALSVASIVLAYFTWKHIEWPFRNKKIISRKQIFTLTAAASAAFCVLGIIGNINQGFEGRFDEKVKTALRGAQDRNKRQTKCLSGGDFYLSPEMSCVIGDKEKIIGALVGDSHADALASALQENLQSKGLGLKNLTFSGCPPVKDVYRADASGYERCAEYNREAASFLAEHEEYSYVVVSARWTLYFEKSRYDNGDGGIEHGEKIDLDVLENGKKVRHPEEIRRQMLADKYKETIWHYLDSGKKVLLIYPIPEVGWDVPKSLTKVLMSESQMDLSTSYDNFKKRTHDTYTALDRIGEHPNLIRIRPDRILCDSYTKGRCISQLNGIPLYYDNNHLSTTGARLIVEEIVDDIVDANGKS